MCICMTCMYALYDGMCLKQGKFTLLDAPACDGYKLRVDDEVSQLKTENVKLRELVFKYAEIANYFCEREDYCSCDFVARCRYYKPQQCRLGELNDRLSELGIEVSNG